jgi:hypothetical protein
MRLTDHLTSFLIAGKAFQPSLSVHWGLVPGPSSDTQIPHEKRYHLLMSSCTL